MQFCATCPAFEAGKEIPPEVALRVGAQVDGGLCRLNPQPVPRTATEWCMQHPGLRARMIPHIEGVRR